MIECIPDKRMHVGVHFHRSCEGAKLDAHQRSKRCFLGQNILTNRLLSPRQVRPYLTPPFLARITQHCSKQSLWRGDYNNGNPVRRCVSGVRYTRPWPATPTPKSTRMLRARALTAGHSFLTATPEQRLLLDNVFSLTPWLAD